MAFLCEEHRPGSAYVEAFWRIKEASSGSYQSAADGQWDLAFIREPGVTKVLLAGPSSHASPITYKANNRNFGIRFRRGIALTGVNAHKLLDTTIALPHSRQFFWLFGQKIALPSFENLDVFVASLAKNNLITQDHAVLNVLAGQKTAISDRTVQRHFLQTTGLTYRYLRQVDRARLAIALLQNGTSIAQAANDAGYADQAHLTRSLKYLTSQTPAQIMGRMSFPFNPYLGIAGVIQVQ